MCMRHAHGNPALVLFVLAVACCAPRAAAGQGVAPAVKTEIVPLKKIVLFNAGVGYFEHGGQVEGDATVDLRFNVDDINDLLKSMVLQDLGGGNISTVTYASRDPVTRALQTFSIDLTQSPSLADLLRQIRGEKVDLEIEGTPKPERVEGTILGVETRKKPVGDKGELVDVDMLSLLTQFGLRNVRLDNVNTIRLVNPKLNDELQQALAILATSHSTDRKTVTLAFQGKGRREVRVGYIQETPIWKTSYRLVLDDEQKPYLQGWAIVENTTEEDWDNVDLTLISGRPISFRMDLYQPLYVTRPLVVPELFASLLPRTYDQDLGAVENEFRANAKAAAAPSAGSNALADANRAVRKADSLADEKGAALRGRRAAEPQMAAANLQASLPSVAHTGGL